MKHRALLRRILAAVLAVTMLAGYAVPVGASNSNAYQHLSFEKVDDSVVTAQPPLSAVNELDQAPAYADSEIVRVSIVLDRASTLETGFSTVDIANNADAMAYRASLKEEQDAMVTAIEQRALNGGKLDVVWNITLAGNIISANVPYGQIDEIEAVRGVQQVLIENRYEPMVVDSDGGVDPNMATSGEQIGTSAAYAAGYTGAGSRIAVIDTGTDSDHQSFDAGAFEYSLAQLDGEYDLMDMEDIREVLDELNISVTPEQAYHNAKLPFAYNYVDRDYDITHDNDAQGGHGSHVAGIAAANAYIPDGNGGYTNALSSVYVQGVAPDAQLITLKVFGKNGGAFESDYIVAIEDAVILGADSVNLSLGSGNPGRSKNPDDAYQRIMDNLVNSDTVVTVSAGNSGHWADYATHMKPGYLYIEDVGTHTGGAPGSFTNSLTIASVENDGNTGYFIQVEDVISVYEEDTKYYQNALRTLQGEREYVFFENVGVDASGSNLMEEYADVVDGKVVLVSRGESNFSDKHDAVDELGGIACIVYNNQPGGTFGMDLSSSWTDIPCVSITAADAANIAAVSEPVCDEAGNVLYYTGTMTVGNSYASAPNYSEYYTMSSFSSWGVPVSLELKPDIVAPGGNIYSVDGTDWNGKAYRLMSGTSMAAPQAAGMSALVAQYLRETGLAEAEGLTVRALTQSLLMSTASPMLDSTNQKYYPVIQQGAGLADVGEAISAQSYVLMGEGACKAWADGKVKAELGDDPDRNGVYSFSFSLNNLTDTDKVYTLSSDIFTQDILLASDGEAYMDRLIRPLSSTVEFLVDGKSAEASDDLIGLDFNGDTLVNEADGQMLLDYATGVVTELTSNAELADLDADGDVDSYDAYLFFSMMDDAVVVPANGTADVTVTVTLSDADKAFLDENFVNGAYVQGYIFAEGLSTEEGVQGTEHSIPMMAFYGNWSDPSMYDPGNYMEYITNTREHDSYMNVPEVNAFYINYADRPGEDYYFGGNPIVPDDTYMPERNAFNNEKGDLINDMRFGAIRNAGQSRYTAANTTTGEIMEESILGAIDGAYFNVIQGSWQNNNWMLQDLFFNAPGANENDVVELTLTLVPDYYVADDGSVEWDKLGAGTDLSISMVIDNTDPVLEDVKLDLENNTLTVVASDNQYISGICLYNKSGTKLYTYTGAKQEIQPGESAEYVLDLNGVNGKRFTVQVTDYAMNTSTYFIEQQIGEEVPLPAMLGFATTAGDEEYWIGFDRNIALDNDYYAEYQLPHYAPALDTFYGATMIDHMVLASTDEGKLYIMPADDMGDMTLVGYLGCTVTDMAYDKANDVVYGVTDKSQLVTIDKMSAKVTVLGKIGISTNTLAYQDGTFYCALLGTNELYSFTLDTLAEPELLVALTYFDSTWYEDVNFVWDDVQGMEIDPNTGKLCWTSYSFESILYDFGWGEPFYSDRIYSYFIEVDPETAEYEVYNDIMWRVCAMAIPEKTIVEGDWSKPTDTAEGVRVTEDEITVYERYSVDLDATVYPWTATDRSVTWSTENESIATVDENGLVTGHAEGTTTVTATSALDHSLSASCTVHVEKLQVTLDGVLQKAGGETVLYNWNLADDATWEEGITLMPTLTAATYDTVNDKLYIMDGTSFSWRGHRIDPTTGEIEASSAAYTSSVTWDLAYSQRFSTESSVKVAAVMEDYVLVPQDLLSLSGQYISLFDYLYKFGGSIAVAIASGGPQEYYDPATDYTYDTELFYVLDDAGNVWYLWIYKSGAQYKAFISCQPSTLPELAFEGYSVVKGCSMVMGDDGALYLSYFNGITNELYRLAYNAEEECWESATLGDFGRNVWPAPITAATSNLPVSNAVAMPTAFAHVSAMEMDEQSQTEAANAAAGSLNTSTSHANAEPMSNVAENNDKVILNVTAKDADGADVDSTNAVMTVTFDAAALTLENIVVNGDYISINDTDVAAANGSITFGYVKLDGFAAKDVVATLTFSRVEGAEEVSAITVTTEEVNNEDSGYVEEKESVCEHEDTELTGAVEATCTENGYTGDEVCTICGKVVKTGEVIPAYCPSETFEDLDMRQWYHEYTDYVIQNGLMNGMSDTRFAPHANSTRAQLVTVLYRMAGSPEVELSDTFKDVSENAWYAKAVAWAEANGITTGTTATLFQPETPATRQQMVTFFARYAKLQGVDVTPKGDLSGFSDVAEIDCYAEDAMIWAVESNLVNGMGNGTIAPKGNATRVQVAAILMRYCKTFN